MILRSLRLAFERTALASLWFGMVGVPIQRRWAVTEPHPVLRPPVYGASKEDTLAWWRTIFRLGRWRGPRCLAEGGDSSREARLSSEAAAAGGLQRDGSGARRAFGWAPEPAILRVSARPQSSAAQQIRSSLRLARKGSPD